MKSVKGFRRSEAWRAAYAELQRNTKPVWDKFLKIAKEFDEGFNPEKGFYSDQWEKEVYPAFLECERLRRPYLEAYDKKCRALGVGSYAESNFASGIREY